MIAELLGLAGIGAYLYYKYGDNDTLDEEYHKSSRDFYRTKKKYTEIDRVIFGKYISRPYDTEYFEFKCNSDVIPASNDLRQAIFMSSRHNPPIRLRASCSICDCKNGTYLHRWMVCCGSINDIRYKDELIYSIYGEYRKARILTE